MVSYFVVLMAFDVGDNRADWHIRDEVVDGGDDVIFRVEGRGGWCEPEGAKLVDLFDEALIVAEHVEEGKLVEMLAVEAEVADEKKAGDHAVAFGSVGTRVIAWDGAGTGSNPDGLNGEDPACCSL